MTPSISNGSAQAVPRNGPAVWRAATVFAALAAFLLAAMPARADQTLEVHAMMYSGPGLCVYGQAKLTRHDTANEEWNIGLYPEVTLGTFANCTGASSTYTWKIMPTGWTLIGRQLWYSTGGPWTVCKDFGFATNGEPLASQDLQVWNGLGPHPCGPGFYGLMGGFYAWDGHTWQGNWLWTGYLYSQ